MTTESLKKPQPRVAPPGIFVVAVGATSRQRARCWRSSSLLLGSDFSVSLMPDALGWGSGSPEWACADPTGPGQHPRRTAGAAQGDGTALGPTTSPPTPTIPKIRSQRLC